MGWTRIRSTTMVQLDNPDGVDVDQVLTRPLTARVATNGPTIRPVWFLWEAQAFWWLTGSYSRLPERLMHDPEVALAVDTYDLSTGEVIQIIAYGPAEVRPFQPGLARRKLHKYLGPDDTRWDPRFSDIFDAPDEQGLVRLAPRTMRARDLSFRPA